MEYININNEKAEEGNERGREWEETRERERERWKRRKRDLLVISICSVGGLSLMGISSDNWENLIKAIVGSIKTTLISMHYEQPNLTEVVKATLFLSCFPHLFQRKSCNGARIIQMDYPNLTVFPYKGSSSLTKCTEFWWRLYIKSQDLHFFLRKILILA